MTTDGKMLAQTQSVSRRMFKPVPGQELVKDGPVRMRVVESPDHAAVLEVSISYEQAEVPSRAYYADFCDVVASRGGYTLIFGKLGTGANALRTKIEVVFAEQTFVRQVWGTSEGLRQSVKSRFMENPLPAIEEPDDTDKVQTFRANAVFMVMLGEECLMDFYYLAPSDIHFVRAGKKTNVALDAIVRVTMPWALMHEFFQRAEAHISRLSHLDAILNDEVAE